MAVWLKLDQLSEEQKKKIRKYLFLQPKQTNFVANRFGSVAPDPILFYSIDKPNNKIILPYTFANSLMKKRINSELEYPEGKFQYTGKLRDYQVPIVEKALSHLNEFGTTTLLLGTGLGKSTISAYLTSKLGGLALVLLPRETIQKGWVSTFEEHTDAGVWVVGKKIKVPEKCNVILCMEGRFLKIPEEIRKMVTTLVIDEAHMFSTPDKVAKLLGTFPKYVIACTATLERDDGMEKMIYNIVGYHNIEVKVDKKFEVYKLNTGIQTELVKNRNGITDFSQLNIDLANSPERNALIVDLIETNLNRKIMLLSWSKSHISLLYQILKKRKISVDYLSGTKSSYVDSKVLLGTISKVSTGFDSKNVAIDFDGIDINMLILAGTTKSKNLHLQSIGRAFRCQNPVIIDLVDDNRISKSHWYKRKQNYSQMNCEIKEFSMNKEVNVEDRHKERLQAFRNRKEGKDETFTYIGNPKEYNGKFILGDETGKFYEPKDINPEYVIKCKYSGKTVFHSVKDFLN